MYLTATQILDVLDKNQVLDKLIDEHKDYQLVITGHSLGAGVASVLAVLLKPKEKYSNLVCYAFSPPGCVLRYFLFNSLIRWLQLNTVVVIFPTVFLWLSTPETSQLLWFWVMT